MRRALPAFGVSAACAMALSACAMFGAKPVCASCGTVVSITSSSVTRTNPGGGGTVLGGIVGGVAASRPATTAQAAATGYVIRVRMDDGREVTVHQANVAGIRQKAAVRVINGRVVAATTVTAKP